MLKRVPYNSRLISIGNANHYEGQPVYSDGRVVYGWQYASQGTAFPITRKAAGLWVGAETWDSGGNNIYILMDEDLHFDKVPIRGLDPGSNFFSYYCYPWVCDVWTDWTDYTQHGEMILNSETHYEFQGNIVRMDNQGNVLTYYWEYDSLNSSYSHYWLCQYSNDGSVVKTDLKPLSNEYGGFYDFYQITAGDVFKTNTITSLNTEGGYVTVKNPDTQAAEPWLHFYCSDGVCTEVSFPSYIQLSDQARLLLPSLDLKINNTTYQNDPLRLLDSIYTSWQYTDVNGVHAYKDIVISQFSDRTFGSGFIFKDGTLYDRNAWYESDNVLVSPVYCWSLSEVPGGVWDVGYQPW